jgi:exodeoxyribonuclease VII large subunit
VGHEIDFTISDFVADVRAATPSAAAEILTEGVFSSGQFVAEAGVRLHGLVWQGLEDKRASLETLLQRLARMHPRRRLHDWLQRLDDLQTSVARCAKQAVRQQRLATRNLAERLGRVRPALVVKQRREIYVQTEQRLQEQVRHRLREAANRLATATSRLRLLGPEQVLARGYSITMDACSGGVLRQAADLKPGQLLRTRLHSGEVKSRVEGPR